MADNKRPPARSQNIQPPQQVFPDPEAGSDPGVTAANIRELREEVLRELEEDSPRPPPAKQGAIWALAILLAASIAVLMLLTWHDSPQETASSPPAETAPSSQKQALRPALQPAALQPKNTPLALPAPAVPASKQEPPRDPRLAEIGLIVSLMRDDASYDLRAAINRLEGCITCEDETVRVAAHQALAAAFEGLERQARAAARTAAETAQDCLERQNFSEALRLLEGALQALPKDVPWAVREGRTHLEQLLQETQKSRDAAHGQAFAGLLDGLRRGEPRTADKLTALLVHPDSAFRSEAAALQTEWQAESARKKEAFWRREAEARAAWREFFQACLSAMANGNCEAALKLAAAPADSPLRQGWAADSRAVLAGFAADAAAIRGLCEIALDQAGKRTGSVELAQHKGQSISGTIIGVENRQFRVRTAAGPVVGVKAENLNSAGLANVLPPGELAARKLEPVLWALQACEKPSEAERLLTKQYAALRVPVPAHWAEFFRMEHRVLLEHARLKALEELRHALNGGADPPAVEALLAAAREACAAVSADEPLAPQWQALLTLAAAEAVKPKTHEKICLQTGVSPAASFNGLVFEQITGYRESARMSKLPLAGTLKAGASGGLQRVLLRIEDLGHWLGKRRVRSAILELYQTESSKASGAALGLYRLKRHWAAGESTWFSYGAGTTAEWSAPGACGGDDAEPAAEAQLTLDARKDLWRAFDITRCIQDVLAGKAANDGLLLRVINGEPGYSVRFAAPDCKDAALRPRLVLDGEIAEPPENSKK